MLDSDEAFQWTIGLGGDFSAGNSSVVDLTLDGGCAIQSLIVCVFAPRLFIRKD